MGYNPDMRIAVHSFRPMDFVGGDLAVDFVNTATDWDVAPCDWLDGYPRLVEWAAMTGRFDPAELAALQRIGDTDAAEALARAKALRLAIYDVLRAAADGRAPPADAAALVMDRWKQAAQVSRLDLSTVPPHLDVDVAQAGPDLIVHRVVASAMDLVTSERMSRLKRCHGSRCGWLFVDTSKAGRRRWCDMATCGNDEKARRHAARHRGGAAGDSS
jgi:predicted RNA-binding Zn ribbon-like protein